MTTVAMMKWCPKKWTFNSIKLPKPLSSSEEAMNVPDKDKWIPVNMQEFQQMDLRKCELYSINESLLPITGKLRYVADRTRWDICATVGEIYHNILFFYFTSSYKIAL